MGGESNNSQRFSYIKFGTDQASMILHITQRLIGGAWTTLGVEGPLQHSGLERYHQIQLSEEHLGQARGDRGAGVVKGRTRETGRPKGGGWCKGPRDSAQVRAIRSQRESNDLRLFKEPTNKPLPPTDCLDDLCPTR